MAFVPDSSRCIFSQVEFPYLNWSMIVQMKTCKWTAAALGTLMLGLAQLAGAHATPKQQTPAADAEVSPPPKEVRIVFNDELESAFSAITVIDTAGKKINSAKAVVDAHNKKLMTVALPALAAGSYQVQWTAVADDGHRTQGHFSFKVK